MICKRRCQHLRGAQDAQDPVQTPEAILGINL